MRFRLADIPGATAASLVVPALVLVAGLLAGMVTAVIGSLAGERAIYYVAVFGLIVFGGIVAVTRTEPLRFVFLALIACFPIADVIVPPGRLGLTVFPVVMIALTMGLIGKKLLASSKASEPLFPTPSLLIAWLFAVPCVVMSKYPSISLNAFIGIFAIYTFFLFVLVLLWSVVSLILAAGLFVDHFLHVSLSVQGNNLNQLAYAGSLEIYRAGGFFQDPQKGGAFLACMITFLLVLSVRGRFRGMRMRFVVWAAIAVGSVALVTTISRSAILACLLVSGLALFAFNKWNAAAKLALMGSMVLLVIVMALMPIETWRNIVPAAITERFVTLGKDLEVRRNIWFDTWNMFADHPLAGIGLGSFRPFLIETRPTVFNFYGIASERGVAYVPDQPESGYFKILYEGGIAGSIAALLVAGDALRRAAPIIAGSDSNPDARTEGIAALAALITFGLTFVTLFTVGDARVAAILAFLLAVIWHRSLSARAWYTEGLAVPRC